MRTSLGLSGEAPTPLLVEHLDGVGLVRGEYVFRGAHAYITVPAVQELLTGYLIDVAAAFAPRPVWYRTSDLDCAEVAVLAGCDAVLDDPIRLLGTRGVRRAMALPHAFRLELAAVAAAAEHADNLGLVIPFVSELEEVDFVVAEARGVGLAVPLGCMVETPAAVALVPELVERGVGHLVVGANDLRSLTMGAVRGAAAGDLPLGFVRQLEQVRAAAPEVEVALAGYLDHPLLEVAARLGFDEVVVHYSDLARVLGPRFADLPDRHLLRDVKAWTRAEVVRLGYRVEAITRPEHDAPVPGGGPGTGA